MTLRFVITGFLLCSCVVTEVHAEEAQDSDLQKQIDELSAKVDALEKSKPALPLRFDGRIQLDYNLFDGAYNAAENGTSGSDLFARRVRLGVNSTVGDWDHTILLDFAEGNDHIVMARIRYAGFGNGVRVQFGKLREDISLNALTSSNNLSLIERSHLADSFSPYFRWGASAYQYHEHTGLRWALGVHKNDAFGASGENSNGRLTLAYTGRLTWSQLVDQHVLHLGAWHSRRDMGGNTLSPRLARGEVRKTPIGLVNYSAGGTTAALDSLHQSGIEVAYQKQNILLEMEYARRELKTMLASDPLNKSDVDGFYLTLSYFPSGEVRPYSTGSAVFGQPRNIANSWEFVTRLSRFNASSENQGTDVTTYTIGTNYYFNTRVRLMANIIYSEVSGPGQQALVGTEDSGKALAARLQYLF
ncbi:OprO/OprP family phosphate-selective porin [Alkalimonas mucilaginosa]|uniref:Porin n=1 Tax=Alkalimonas mucilaginosa TaxID=3057676 RepID=A0ABU7JDL6_9GAMM|nr:porin [Alkalimonas sp. MEB004]MEE2023789.1 porin [Alkalimonas sp. MEB004]